MSDLPMNYLEKEFHLKIKNNLSVFNFIIQDVLDGVFFWDLENPENEWMSPKYWELLGYAPEGKSNTPEAWQAIMHPDDKALSKLLLNKHFENPAIPYEQTVRFFDSNGETIWINCRAQALPNKEGKLTRMFGAHFKSNALVVKNDGAIESQNREVKSLIQALENDEKESKTDFYLEQLLKPLNEKLNNQNKNSVGIYHENDKKPYPEKLIGFLNNSSNDKRKINSFIQNLSNVSELKNQIKSRDFLLDYFKQNSKDGMIIFNNKLEAIYINESVGNLIGVKFEKYPVSIFDNLKYFHPEDLKELIEVISTALGNQVSKITTQHRAISPIKGIAWIESKVSFTYDKLGKLDKAFVVSRDITKTKELELKLKKVSKKRKEISELLIEEREKNKEELYTELHDGINQLLFAARLNIQNSGIADEKLEQVKHKLKTAIEHIRKIALESTTQFVFNDDFTALITDYLLSYNQNSKTKFVVDIDVQDTSKITKKIKKHIFRIIQHLVHFSTEYSNARQSIFRIKQIDDDFVVINNDNGKFDSEFFSKCLDIKSITDRIYLIDGEIRFFNFSNKGLSVYIKIKLNE